MEKIDAPLKKNGHRFKPGQSGNPRGRPKGTPDKRSRLRRELAGDAPAIIRKVIEAAKNGDMQAARLILERLLSPLKNRAEPVQFALDVNAPLAEQAGQIMASVSQGKLDPDTGKMLIDGLASLARVAELDEVRERIERLEAINESGY